MTSLTPTAPAAIVSGFGPWAPGIDDAERRARLRSLRALVLVLSRSSWELNSALCRAEAEVDALPYAWKLFSQMPSLSRRRVLSTYQLIHRPAAGRGAFLPDGART